MQSTPHASVYGPTYVCKSMPASGSISMFLYVQIDHKDYLGRGAQDGHLDFHTLLPNSVVLLFLLSWGCSLFIVICRAKKLCESRAGGPVLPLIVLMVSVDVKQH